MLSTTEFIVDTFVVLGKLDFGKWKTWATDEQKVINDFLLTWWTDMTKVKNYFDKEAFIEIYKLLEDINPLLDRWVISFDDNSFKNLSRCDQKSSDERQAVKQITFNIAHTN